MLLALAAAACSRPEQTGVRTDSVLIPSPSLSSSVVPNAPEQPALVLLPPSYSSSSRAYPVIYFLPGFTTDVTEYIDGTFDGFDFRRPLAARYARHPDAEVIVVIVNGRNALGGSFYVNSPVAGRWEDFVVGDVVSWIDARYRTVRDRDARFIWGEGMGGFGALSLAMRHPDLFGRVHALSPELFDEAGLEESGLLSRPSLRRAWLIDAARMASWPAEQAPHRFVRLVDDLYAANSWRFNRARAFVLAYGAAFAPDPGGKPPFIAYPVRETDGGTVIDDEIRRRWEDGYGGWGAKVTRYREALRSLRAIDLDIGRNDTRAWTPRGARRVAELLRREGIEPEIREHDGGHFDRLAERVDVALDSLMSHGAAGK
jgi:pimeloyl-ACP methyl ester carboxylesterase